MGAVPATRPTVNPRRRPARAPARRPARITPPGGFAKLPVSAVGRTAGALGGIADSGLVGWLTRGRAWIALLGVLLAGIVAVNVYGLSLSAKTSAAQTKIDQYERLNSVLAGRVDRRSSSLRIQEVASALGLATPAPDLIRYLKPAEADAGLAAERLGDGSIGSEPIFEEMPLDPTTTAVAPVAPVDPTTVAPIDPAVATAAPVDPGTAAPVDPATTVPAPVEPAAVAPAPTAAAAAVPAAEGGVAPTP